MRARPSPHHEDDPAVAPTAPMRGRRAAIVPFAGLIDPVLVRSPVEFVFEGSVGRDQAAAAWIWFGRDLSDGVLGFEALESGAINAEILVPLLPGLLGRAREALAGARGNTEARRRLRAQLGGEAVLERLPMILEALRNRDLLAKAEAFGRATNAIADEAALAAALQSMPLRDKGATALLMHATVGPVRNPTRLVTAVLKLADAPTEPAIVRAGFGPLIEAMMAHAQDQQHAIGQGGPFADMDMTCRAIERFHRLVRAITGYVELEHPSRWSGLLAGLTRSISERIEPRLREVVPDVNGSLRRARDGGDRLDEDRLLAAIGGMYLLVTLRECKDSLALNALFERAWTQSGQALDLHLNRNLELLREEPGNAVVAARLEAGIKMAEIRFNPEYAETLRRARAAAVRR